MMQTELTKKNLTAVGEAISHELGAQMIQDFKIANPTEVQNHYIGRNIIDQILAQPGCVGISFNNAYNEIGEKTLVYIGVDSIGKPIVEYAAVTPNGELQTQKAIVADRVYNDDLDGITEWIASIFA